MIEKMALSGVTLCFFVAVILMTADICNDYTLHLRAVSGGFFCGMLACMAVAVVAVTWKH